MRLTLFFLIITCRLVSFSQKPTLNLEEVTNEILSIDAGDTTFADLHFLQETFKDKRIIILGESGHGDGSTFQAKTRLIKYLHESQDFNTIAFEGGGFFEMYYANLQLSKGADFKEEFTRSWYHLWSKSEQTQALIDYLADSPSLDFIGIENQAGNEYWLTFPTILQNLLGEDAFKDVPFNAFRENQLSYYYIYFLGNKAYNEEFDVEEFKSQLNTLYENITLIESEHQAYMLQATRNIQGFIAQLELNAGDYEAQIKGIRMRDSLMYANLKYFLDRNPEEKVIVWTANFHGAKNINQAQYKEGDDFYQVMKTLGQFIHEDYKEEFYSLAFISSIGETAIIYQQDAEPIILDDACWENEIEKHFSYDYAFIDFSLLKKKYDANMKFNSCLLGYKSKQGSWLNIFDGVFYIRKMERSVPVQENDN